MSMLHKSKWQTEVASIFNNNNNNNFIITLERGACKRT